MRWRAWIQFLLIFGAVFGLAGAVAFGLYRLSGSLPVFWAAFFSLNLALSSGLASVARRKYPERPQQRFHPLFYLGYVLIASGAIVTAAGYSSWGNTGLVVGALLFVVGMRRSGPAQPAGK